MTTRGVLLLSALAGAWSCAALSGYDPDRYTSEPHDASVDPEVAPLGHPPKRWMRDPRSPIDASVADAE
jgi:hypothetical protein